MGIWIRSQNNELLVECNDIRIDTQQNSCNIIANYEININGDVWECLGNYSSKEKAIKVLDEFNAKIINNEYCASTGKSIGSTFYSCVYKMPLDEEVKV